jgi:hypothetical protein
MKNKKEEKKHALVKVVRNDAIVRDNRLELALAQNAELREHVRQLRMKGRPDFRDIVYYSSPNLSGVMEDEEASGRAYTLVRWVRGAIEKLATCAEIERAELVKVRDDSLKELEVLCERVERKKAS